MKHLSNSRNDQQGDIAYVCTTFLLMIFSPGANSILCLRATLQRHPHWKPYAIVIKRNMYLLQHADAQCSGRRTLADERGV